MSPKISIVIPTYTRADKLRECLTSIINQTEPEGITVYVVANGAPQETRKAYAEFRYQWQGDAQLLWYDEPLGYTVATNKGIVAAWDSDFIILLNDDCMFTANAKHLWLQMLLDPFVDPQMGITGPLMNWCHGAERHFLVFFCVMIRKTMLEEIGILDEIFSPGSGEDTDLCSRAVDRGWKIKQVPTDDALPLVDKGCEDLPEWKRQKMHVSLWPGFHDGNATFSAIPEIYEPAMRKNHAILQERYGNKMNTPSGSCGRCGGESVDSVCVGAEGKLNCDGLYLWRASVVDGWFGIDEGAWVAAQVKALPRGSKVLSVGAWHGRSSRFIADNLPEGVQLWDIDSFLGSSGEPEMHGTAHWDRGDHAFQWYFCNLAEHIEKGRVVPVRMWSENAATTLGHLIEKEELDKFSLLFIDGDHSDEGIRKDVEAWLPLLKDGGLICGHDYYKESEGPHWVHVRQYVEAKFPDVQKAATSLWWTRKSQSVDERLSYQINEAHCDLDSNPEYAAVVEHSQREMIDRLFSDVTKDGTILDVGCGSGIALEILKKTGFTNAIGIDLVDKADATVLVRKADMHSIPYGDGSFDVIYSSHSLEHAYDPIKALSEFKRVLKPDGQLFLILPYPDVLYDEHRAKAHCGSEKLGLTIDDGAQTLIKTIEDAGFHVGELERGNLRNEAEIYLKFTKQTGHIYDCMIMSNEMDLLELRFNTLYDTVDRFVIVEGTRYHNGEPKPLFFNESLERFQPFLDKVSHIVVDDWPEANGSIYDNAWMMERWQRDAIMRGLVNCSDNDIIILGDADEIPNPAVVKEYKTEQGLCRLKQRLFYYYLNCENKEGWDWQKIAPYKTVRELSPCGIRYPPSTAPIIENAGWHFSFIGGSSAIAEKIRTYSHREFATPEILDKNNIESAMRDGRDVFGRDLKYEFVEIDESYPEYVKENEGKLRAAGLIKQQCTCPVLRPMAGHWYCAKHGDVNYRHSSVEAESSSLGKHWTVTAEISTKDRYQTTLPLALVSVITQTRKPEKLKIYDDGEQLDLREISPFSGLLKTASELGIDWEILKTPKQGQVTNHQHCLENASTDFIWRIDDDSVAMPNCLERLLNTVRDFGIGGDTENIGAVGGLVHHPGNVGEPPAFLDGSLKDVDAGLNLAWYNLNGGGPRLVEHLYSTFLLRVDFARKVGGYPKGLSKIGHREETLMSHFLHRAGYKVILQPSAKTYHLRESTGGIRSFNDQSMWDHDEQVFQSYRKEWGMNGSKPTKILNCDFGIGDHFALKSVLRQIIEKHADKEVVLATCFPSVFEDSGLKQISIADCKQILGDRYEDSLLYKHLWEVGHKGSLTDGMMGFWG